jgi:hypothetical protein
MNVMIDPSIGLFFFCTCSVVGFLFGYHASKVAAAGGASGCRSRD